MSVGPVVIFESHMGPMCLDKKNKLCGILPKRIDEGIMWLSHQIETLFRVTSSGRVTGDDFKQHLNVFFVICTVTYGTVREK